MIHRIAAAGDRRPALGREGEGPGELNQPGALAVNGDTLTVVDVRNARFQQMHTADGSTLGTRTAARPAGDGWAAFPTAGLDTMLVALVGPDGEAVGLGRIEGEPSNFVREGESCM